ncbi:uncharacterized protein LOC143297462 [Babylonia areolata]|uniref:uncharacterized protein LOC143297462 n=1 Tax=Babylonia areolata TaxID=304850 RepID=UPI003FD61576
MDTDKKAEESQSGDTTPAESCESQEAAAAAAEESSQKRKREDDGDCEVDQNIKKAKVEEEEKVAVADEKEEESSKKEDSSGEKEEEDKDVKPAEEKPSSPAAGEGEGKAEEGEEKDKVTDQAEDAKQDEKMDVDDSTVKTDTLKTDTPEKELEKEQTAEPEEKKESNEKEEGETGEPQTEKSEAKESESEEKSEVVRRYPTRNRRVEEKGASQPIKAGGSTPDDKKQGSVGMNKNENSQDSDSSNRAASVKSDSGSSDKENMNGDTAVDVSNAGTPDVIMLSDEEESEQAKEKKAKRKKLVRRLQAHLRNEEAKLVLLKKLRQSQLTPQVQDHTPVSNSSSNQLTKQAMPRQQGGPPPLVRGNQQIRGSNLHMQQQNRTPSQSQMRNVQGPPPLVVTPRMGGSNTTNGHGSQNLRNSTPHMNQHSSTNHRSVQQQQQQSGHNSQQTAQHQQAATPPQPQDTQTPAQRQAAAKLALRKQLEKTLLQIPPPKPPAPEMNFIPSLACPDFVLLLGLEEVVNHIIDLQLIARGQKSPDEKFICNPFTCVQCGTDYTPVWKREKPGSKNVICEHCVTWNQKRALKQEHTNRLKSAFVKALQQEQEIERMQAQTPSNPSTPTPSVTPPNTASSSSTPSQALAAAAAASNVAAAAAMSMSPASFRPSAEQVRQHHNFLQAQAQLRGQPLSGLQGFGARSPFPYNLPYVKQADLQRQYLLDMIPRAAGMPWKQ